ncbi:MAG: DUF58 domain-containing protein [Gemmatimonadetes bacterium]|nr:DUF58 domain-containing protein [Gemmatimonadota bacterium]
MKHASAVVGADVLRQVKSIELRTRRLVSTLLTGDYRSVFRGQGMEFAEVRAYEHGDDFRSIDWNVSARMASPYVKLFDEERELTVLLIIDRSGSIEFGDPVAKSRIAVEVGAVLALAAARQNDRVGTIIFSDEVDHVVRPAKGKLHAMRVIRDMIAFEPLRARTDISNVLTYAGRLLRHRSIIVVISDFRDSGWERQLRNLSHRHEVVAVTVDDPKELELPDVGWVEIEDAETGERLLIDTSDSEARIRLRIAAEEMRLSRAKALDYAGADHVALRTDRPYARALHNAFAKRARRLRR